MDVYFCFKYFKSFSGLPLTDPELANEKWRKQRKKSVLPLYKRNGRGWVTNNLENINNHQILKTQSIFFSFFFTVYFQIICCVFYLSLLPSPLLIVIQWVLVTHVVNPRHFYVRYVAEKRKGEILSKKIDELCSRDGCRFTQKDTVEIGMCVCGCMLVDVFLKKIIWFSFSTSTFHIIK